MHVLDPTGATTATAHGGDLSPRLDGLAGCRVVAVWNGRRPGPGKEVLEGVGARLQERHGLASFELLTKPWIGNQAPPELVDRVVASADAAITGVGD